MYGYCTQLIQRLQEFKDVKEKIEGLKPQLDRLKRNVVTTTIDGDPEEIERRSELTRYARQLFTPPTLANRFRSALEEVEKRSKELLGKSDGSSVRGQAGGFGGGGETHRTTPGGYHPLPGQ